MPKDGPMYGGTGMVAKTEPAPEQLKRLRNRAGYSMEDIAKAMGYKGASSYQRFENPNRYKRPFFPAEFVARLFSVLYGRGNPPITYSEILALAGFNAANATQVEQPDGSLLIVSKKTGLPVLMLPRAPRTREIAEQEEELAEIVAGGPENRVFPPRQTPVTNPDLPILGSAQCGDDGAFEFNVGEPQGWKRRPPQLDGIRDAYVVYAVDDSMEPRYHSGELVYVDPTQPVRPNCYVVVQLKPIDGTASPRAFIKQFLRQDNDVVYLRQLNPKKDIRIPRGQVESLHRIVLGGDS